VVHKASSGEQGKQQRLPNPTSVSAMRVVLDGGAFIG